MNILYNWKLWWYITKFAITDKKRYAAVVTLSAQDNEKLLQQLKTGFKRTINWNKYQSEPTLQTWSPYVNYLINPSFQGVNRLFLSLFENDAHQLSYKRYFLLTVEIKDYNVMIDEKDFFDQPVKNDFITYENIRKIATSQGDNYTTGCLLDYNYFWNCYKMIAIDLSKQQALHADPKAIQQINFTANSDRSMYFITEEAKETVLDFSQGTARVL